MDIETRRTKAIELLANIKHKLPELTLLLNRVESEEEDAVYRFYYQSLKVYWLQGVTRKVIKELEEISPEETDLHVYFRAIMAKGAGHKEFDTAHNNRWLIHTQAFVEAFYHAKYFLKMAVKYGNELEEAPEPLLPSGWAALLCLYGIR